MVAVGGVCATGIFRVATVPALPAKAIADRMCEGDAIRHVPALSIAPVDTLAAGDIFHGALAILDGKPIAEAARFACVAATLKCGRFGGRLGCPTRAEVDAALASSRVDDVVTA